MNRETLRILERMSPVELLIFRAKGGVLPRALEQKALAHLATIDPATIHALDHLEPLDLSRPLAFDETAIRPSEPPRKQSPPPALPICRRDCSALEMPIESIDGEYWYPSVNEAARLIGVSQSFVRKALHKGYRCKGRRWRYSRRREFNQARRQAG